MINGGRTGSCPAPEITGLLERRRAVESWKARWLLPLVVSGVKPDRTLRLPKPAIAAI